MNIGGYEIVGGDEDALLRALSVSGSPELIGEAFGGVGEMIGGLGNTDIIGGVEELIGAAAAGNPNAKAALRSIAVRHAGAVVSNPLDKRRRFPIGVTVTAVATGDTEVIPAAPQNLFRGERLVVPSDIAFDFGIVDVKVGNQSQFVQSVEVPAAMFSEVAIDTHVTFDTAEVGNQISVSAHNKSAGDLDFTAGILGTIAKS